MPVLYLHRNITLLGGSFSRQAFIFSWSHAQQMCANVKHYVQKQSSFESAQFLSVIGDESSKSNANKGGGSVGATVLTYHTLLWTSLERIKARPFGWRPKGNWNVKALKGKQLTCEMTAVALLRALVSRKESLNDNMRCMRGRHGAKLHTVFVLQIWLDKCNGLILTAKVIKPHSKRPNSRFGM